MPHCRPTILALALALAACSDSSPAPAPTPTDSGYPTSIAAADNARANPLDDVLARFNTGQSNYLDLELVVNDPLEVSQRPSLPALTAEAEGAFIARVASIHWEPDPLDGAMTVVTYAQPSVVVFGDVPPGRKVVGRFTGPTSDDPPKYAILEFGVRQRAGETYLVFSRYGPKFDIYYAPSHAPLIRIDGDRIANSEAAKALGIEGKKVSDVIADLRRLKAD